MEMDTLYKRMNIQYNRNVFDLIFNRIFNKRNIIRYWRNQSSIEFIPTVNILSSNLINTNVISLFVCF